jgi:hypothetical protein
MRLSLAPAEGDACRRFEPCCGFAEEVRQRASANVHSEAQRSGEVQELNTAAIIDRKEGVATLHDFRAAEQQ